MKITIKGDRQVQEGHLRLVITDDNLDTDAWVEMSIGEDGEVIQVPLDQLMSAVIAFESKRSRRLSEECH